MMGPVKKWPIWGYRAQWSGLNERLAPSLPVAAFDLDERNPLVRVTLADLGPGQRLRDGRVG
jgi:hypothetical protein